MRLSPALSALLLLTAAPTAFADPARQVTGSVSYLARIALPPGATLLVEARASDGTSLAQSALPTNGSQVPLPFKLALPLSESAQITAAIMVADGTRWIIDPVEIDPGADAVDLGELKLHAFSGIGFDAAYLCGDQRLALKKLGQKILIAPSQATYDTMIELSSDRAATQARFTSDDDRTSAELRADGLLITQSDMDWPLCQPVPPVELAHWQAKGAEPDWSARLRDGQLLVTRKDQPDVELALPEPKIVDRALVYDLAEPSAGGTQPLTLTVGDWLCHDAAGAVYPQEVRLAEGGEVLDGCGGDPRALLIGANWKVESIRGVPVVANSAPSVMFLNQDSVAGSGSCNRYFGTFTLNEGGLSFGQLGATMMACAPEQMAQEAEFHQALAAVTSFDLTAEGALVLRAGTEELLRAHR